MEEQEEKTKLQLLLEKRNMTKMELVRKINVMFPEVPITPKTVYDYISGVTPDIKIRTIKRICLVLGVTPNEIID
jgi:DNA-binding Xre family transcriptional regulator